jgi:translocation and assembly module TamB
MTNPNSEQNPEPLNYRLWLLLTNRIMLTVAALVLAGLAGGAWWAWVWIHQQLAPLVEDNLQQLLGRSVELGEVEGVSFNSLRFGESAIPATPTDSDRVTVEAVNVQFSPWQLLLNRTLQLNITLVEPDAYVEQSADGQWISTGLQDQEGSGLIQTDLETIRFQDANVVLLPIPRPGLPEGTVRLQQVDGIVQFLEQDNQRIGFELEGEFARGGNLEITGETRPGAQETNLMVQAQNVPAANISRLVNLPITLQAGLVSGNLDVELRPEEQPSVTGTARLENVTAQIENIPQRFTDADGRLRFRGEAIALENINTRYGQVPAIIDGVVNLETGYNLSGRVRSVSVDNLLETLRVGSPVPLSGMVRAELQVEGPLREPILSGTVSTINTAQIDQVNFRSITSRFRADFTGETPEISFPEIRAVPQAGGQVIGNGQIQFGEKNDTAFTFRANEVPGDVITRLYEVSPGIRIGDVSAIARLSGSSGNLQTVVQFNAPEATYPGQGEVVITNEGSILLRDAMFNVAGGTVEARGRYAGGELQAVVEAAQVRLNSFAEGLRGRLSGSLNLSGSSFNLADIHAQGRLRFSEGLALIEQPLTAQVRWNGEQVIVQQATAPGLNASGAIAIQLEGAGTPQIAGLNLNVQAEGYNLQAFDLPNNIDLAGQADFTGRVTGTPDAPNAIGDLRLRNLLVNGVAFDPVLTGNVSYRAGEQTTLNVSGTQDRIALTLGPNNRPTSFFVRRNQAIATGRTEAETLLVDLQNFPVAVLQNLLPGDALDIDPIAGDLSGALAINLDELSAEGEVAIANPQIGRVTGDLFRGRFTYTDGVAQLTEGEFFQGESRIALSGGFDPEAEQPIDFRISFDQARIENVLQTLSLFEFEDFATGLDLPDLASAAAVQPNPIQFSNDPLITRLRRLSEIEALLAQQRSEQEAQPLPPLSALQGRLSGAIAITGSPNELNIGFDLLGEDWEWREYTIDRVITEGSFADGTLTALPLRIDFGEGLIAFTGQLAPEQLTGQLRVESLPVELLDPLIRQSLVEVAGSLNAIITLAGSLENPSATGEVNLINGEINDQPIQVAQLLFGYDDARLNFDSDVLLADAEPLEIMGSIPIALPFASVQPESDQIRLSANVEDEGLALINVLTDQVTWIEGEGQLSVAVAGTLEQPIIDGNLIVEDATLAAQTLPEPLTDVTGLVQFNGDRILIDGIQAEYNQGAIVAEGILPIFDRRQSSLPTITNPLTVSFNDLALDLKGLYEGDTSGNVVVTGAALKPEIGGSIVLTDGEIAIGESTGAPAIATGTGAGTPGTPLQFSDLQLILGEDIRVTRQPILNFEVAGDITLNGTLGNLRPQGLVRLTGGEVNLFTTQFRLARGYEQTARFTPGGGLDPILDIRLVATVPEATGTLLPSTTSPSEIADVPVTSFGTLQTVQIEARVTGPASELSENLELSSSPNRSDAEIIALLGGSFINTLGQADTTLGLANLAGSALFSNLQGNISEIGEALGLSELRLSPTIVTDPESEVSVLGLAVEAVVDITDDFSVSISQVIAADDPTRYNLLYRINNQLRLRGSTNFSGESRVLLEYEARF